MIGDGNFVTSDKPDAPEQTPEQQDQPAAKRSMAKPLIWTSSIAAVLVIILIVLHFWLGTWLVLGKRKWFSGGRPNTWTGESIPLWLVGRGFARTAPLWLNSRGEAAIPYLLRTLRSNDARTEPEAILCLRDIAEAARRESGLGPRSLAEHSPVWAEVSSEMVQGLGDEDPEVRWLCAWALYSIRDASAIPHMRRAALVEKDVDAKKWLARALEMLELARSNATPDP